jgi:hypothetical protein
MCGGVEYDIFTFDGRNYCGECFKKKAIFLCIGCKEKHTGAETIMTIDGKILCKKCAKKLGYKKCRKCGQYHAGLETKCPFCMINEESGICPVCKKKSWLLQDINGFEYKETNGNAYAIERHKLLCSSCYENWINDQFDWNDDLGYYSIRREDDDDRGNKEARHRSA